MSTVSTTGRTLPDRRPDRLNRIVGILAIVAIGVLAGLQFVVPDKRVLAVLMAALVFGIAWRLDTVSAIGLLVLALPYPRSTTFGNTNFALLLFLLLIWLLRVRQDPSQAPRPTGVDVPIAGLLIMYVISFYNVISVKYALLAMGNVLVFLSCLGLFYLVANNVRTTAQLQRLHLFQMVSIATIALFGIYELGHPGAVIVPGWIVLGGTDTTEGINLHGMRIGGPFFDYELLAEFAAINLLFAVFLVMRATSGARRVVFGSLTLALLVVMFATLTRGAIVSLGIGTIYLLWMQRRHIRFVPLTIAAAAVVAVIQIVNVVISKYSYSGDVFARLMQPESFKLVGGMPESRAELWTSAFNRMMEHPFIGHGPYYVIDRGISFWYWPHNGYLYIAHLVGLIGLGFYLWILARLWRMSASAQQSLTGPSYARAFLVIANIQLLVFLVDQLKIDYARNHIYTFQVWLLFANIAAAYQIVRRESRAPAAPPAP